MVDDINAIGGVFHRGKMDADVAPLQPCDASLLRRRQLVGTLHSCYDNCCCLLFSAIYARSRLSKH